MKFPSGKISNIKGANPSSCAAAFCDQIAPTGSNQAKYLSSSRCLGSKNWNEGNQFRTGTFVPAGLTFSPGILTATGSTTPDHRDAFETATQS
jgi:hypothetical protein